MTIKLEASQRLMAFHKMEINHPMMMALRKFLDKKSSEFTIKKMGEKTPSPGGVTSYVISATGDFFQNEQFDGALLQLVKGTVKAHSEAFGESPEVVVKAGRGSIPPIITAGNVVISAKTTSDGVDIHIGYIPSA